MFRNLKIRTKLTLIFALLITASIIIISYIGFHIAEESLKSTYIAKLKSIADLKVDKIETFFLERKGDIRTAQDYYNIKTNLPIVTQFANDRTNPAYMAAKRNLDGQLKTFQNVYGYRDVMLVNPEGKIVYVSNEAHVETDLDHPLTGTDGKSFEEGKEGIYFSDVFHVIRNKIEGCDFGMLITAPTHDFNGKFIGVIALEVSMVPIYEFIQDTTGLGETGETLIGLNKGDHVLFLNPLRYDTDAALKRKSIFGNIDAFPIQEAVQGRNGSGLSFDYRSEEIIAAWRHVPSLNWGLVAKIDTSEAFVPVINLRNITIIIVIASIIVIVTISVILSSRITKPIRKLVEGTKRLAKGDHAFRVKIQSRDEIGQLATSFNDMTYQLEKSKKKLNDYALNLEEKVEDKKKEIKKSKEYTGNLTETAQEAIISINENEIVNVWNQTAVKLFGYTKSEIIGKPIITIIPDKYKKKYQESLKMFLKTGKPEVYGKVIELSGKTKKGIEIHLEISLAHQKLGNERHSFTAIIRDVTEKKKLQAEIILAGQMAAVGEIAAGVAHEINNPIYGVINYAQLIVDESDKGSRAHEFGESILEESQRIAGLTKNLLSFSRRTTDERESVQIYELILNFLKMIRVHLKEDNIIIEDNIPNDLPAIIANPHEIQQVFLNLMQNARYALNEKYPGKDKDKILEISCNEVLIDDYQYIRLIFYDRGIGIPENILSKVTSPFFTTKPHAKGTGIGLSISQNIINNHDGKMTIESIPGEFTKIVIDLPVAELTTKK